MNWSRAKTILIFMFLATAIFQSFVLYNSVIKTKNISPEIITACTELLEKNHIIINSDIIPKHNYSLPYVEADNAISDYESFSRLLLGKDMKQTEENAFSSPAGTVTFSGNSFNFLSDSKGLGIKSETSAISKSKELLSALGLDLKNTKESVKQTDTGYEVIFTSHVDNNPVTDLGVTVLVHNGDISQVSGKWFNIIEKSGSIKLKTITSVLIDLIKSDIEKPAEITDISLGYTIPEHSSFQKSVSLVPAWHITFKNGKTLSVDARNPQ